GRGVVVGCSDDLRRAIRVDRPRAARFHAVHGFQRHGGVRKRRNPLGRTDLVHPLAVGLDHRTPNAETPPHMSVSTVLLPEGRSWPRSLPFYYGWINVVLASVAMTATLPGRSHGLGLVTEPLVSDLNLDR